MSPSATHETAQITHMSNSTLVRRRPSIRCKTGNWNNTMSTVLTVNA